MDDSTSRRGPPASDMHIIMTPEKPIHSSGLRGRSGCLGWSMCVCVECVGGVHAGVVDLLTQVDLAYSLCCMYAHTMYTHILYTPTTTTLQGAVVAKSAQHSVHMSLRMCTPWHCVTCRPSSCSDSFSQQLQCQGRVVLREAPVHPVKVGCWIGICCLASVCVHRVVYKCTYCYTWNHIYIPHVHICHMRMQPSTHHPTITTIHTSPHNHTDASVHREPSVDNNLSTSHCGGDAVPSVLRAGSASVVVNSPPSTPHKAQLSMMGMATPLPLRA